MFIVKFEYIVLILSALEVDLWKLQQPTIFTERKLKI